MGVFFFFFLIHYINSNLPWKQVEETDFSGKVLISAFIIGMGAAWMICLRRCHCSWNSPKLLIHPECLPAGFCLFRKSVMTIKKHTSYMSKHAGQCRVIKLTGSKEQLHPAAVQLSAGSLAYTINPQGNQNSFQSDSISHLRQLFNHLLINALF